MNSGLSSDSSQCLGSPYASREPLGIIVAQSPATNLALVLNQFLHGHAQIFEGFRSTHVAVPVGLVEPKLAASSALRTLKSNDYRYFVAGGTCGGQSPYFCSSSSSLSVADSLEVEPGATRQNKRRVVAVAKDQNSHFPLLIVIWVVVQAVDAFSFLIVHALVHFLGCGSCYCHSIVNAFHSLRVVSGWIDTVNHKFH